MTGCTADVPFGPGSFLDLRVVGSAGLSPGGVVSSLDVAHLLIQLGICPFTLGRRKKIRGVREGRESWGGTSSHIWVDGTHGRSTAVSPLHLLHALACTRRSSTLPPSTLAKSTSLVPSIHLYPSSSSSLYFLFLLHQSAHYAPASLLPLRPKRSQMLLYERQSRSVIFFFFGLFYRKWAPLEKGKRNEGKES